MLTLPLMLLLAASCATDPPASDPPAGTTSNTLAIGTCTTRSATDPFSLGNVALDGHDLLVHVTTGGGCADHSFAICWDGTVADTYPGTVDLRLSQDAHGDSCDALLIRDLRVDLTPVLAAFHAPLRVNVLGATAQITGSTGSVTVPE